MRLTWGVRTTVAVSTAVALLVAIWSVEKVSLFPPGLAPRSLEMAAASSEVLVDTPRSALVDLRQDTYQLSALTNRAVLVGNVMASAQVRESIARRANVPAEQLRVEPPLTPKQPRVIAENGNGKGTGDILKLNDQYRLAIRANPTVPILQIYSQAPTAESAEALTNAAVAAMQTHLARLAGTDQTPMDEQIRLVQLGKAHGGVINSGIEWQVAILAFILAFAAAFGAIMFLGQTVTRWRLMPLTGRPASW
jgi:hypothetical protein